MEKEIYSTDIKNIKLLEEKASKSRFPSYLQDISDSWYSVYYDTDHIGEVYLHQGVWRAFTICVDNVDGTLDGCIKHLIRNR